MPHDRHDDNREDPEGEQRHENLEQHDHELDGDADKLRDGSHDRRPIVTRNAHRQVRRNSTLSSARGAIFDDTPLDDLRVIGFYRADSLDNPVTAEQARVARERQAI